MLSKCPVCHVPQVLVTGSGVLRTHDRINLATGIAQGKCSGSGVTPRPPLRTPTSGPTPGPRSYCCSVCGAPTQLDPDTSVIEAHSWPTGDARCLASGRTPRWIPKNPRAGTPKTSHTTGKPLTEAQRGYFIPLRDNATLAERREARMRKAAKAKTRAAKKFEREVRDGRERSTSVRTVSGGLPGLGKR